MKLIPTREVSLTPHTHTFSLSTLSVLHLSHPVISLIPLTFTWHRRPSHGTDDLQMAVTMTCFPVLMHNTRVVFQFQHMSCCWTPDLDDGSSHAITGLLTGSSHIIAGFLFLSLKLQFPFLSLDILHSPTRRRHSLPTPVSPPAASTSHSRLVFHI